MTEVVLKRRYRTLPARLIMIVDLARRAVAWEDHNTSLSFAADWGDQIPLRAVLQAALNDRVKIHYEIVYLVGGWDAQSSPRAEWFVAPAGWKRLTYNRNPFIAVYQHEQLGKRVTLYGSAQWFGKCDDLMLIRDALLRQRVLLRGAFGSAVQLLGTPARTGLDLMERSLPENRDRVAYEYPRLDDETLEKLEHNIGQGRVEMLAIRSDVPDTDKLYVLDAVWMYSACCRRLPAPPMIHDFKPEFANYRPAFYKVRFRVPEGWDHIGLLPVWHPRQRRTVYPFKPGDYQYTSYVSGYELRLSLEQGWPTEIAERWLFADEREPGADPLEQWITKLRMLRDKCTDEAEGRCAPLLRAALRAIVLKGIGSLHRRGRYEQMETPVDQADSLPANAEVVWRTDTTIRWRKAIPLHRDMQHFQHPEWSAYVWSHARSRLARAALAFPRSHIIALRSDAIVLAADPGPEYGPARNTKPGQFRLKEVYELGGLELPRTNRQYLDIRKFNRLEQGGGFDEDDQEEDIE